jgi:hypothetical protein
MTPADYTKLNCMGGIFIGTYTDGDGKPFSPTKVCKVYVNPQTRWMNLVVPSDNHVESNIFVASVTETQTTASKTAFLSNGSATMPNYKLHSERLIAPETIPAVFTFYVSKVEGSDAWNLFARFQDRYTQPIRTGAVGCVAQVSGTPALGD